MELDFTNLAALIAAAKEQNCPISELVLAWQAEQAEQEPDAMYERMRQQYDVMAQAVQSGSQPGVRSTSGLTGGDGYRMQQASHAGGLTGSIFTGALARALAVSEWNAAMGRIVAAPTAGSCGILPAALLTLQRRRNLSEKACVMALFTASGIGMVIARNASISGAEGGCQAECGSASAMAAAALCELCGGTPAMIGHSVAIALKNILGLVCDPVAGLVEIPCEKRNASGVANAFVAAELALAGIESAIPVDEVILAMKRVGDALPTALRETAEGGLAATPTAQALYEKVFGTAQTGCGGCRACRS